MTEIRARDLALARGDRVIQKGLSFTIASGQVLHLRGRNGSGKTTLLEALAGLRPPAAGAIDGIADSEQVHFIGHREGLSPALTALENLQFWCALQGVDATGCEAALRRIDVPAIRTRPCRLLSAGQRRRVAMCRLLLAQRPVWLLDEPLASLDAAGTALFGELLRAHLAGGGMAAISSHQALPVDAASEHLMELT